ncbi:pantothenate kinase [Sulfurimonas denitrificans DSM 1251]|jgi:type III pantothenate kinase|uniref:Type III pantothenate kinase n=2 Tax=Sulfurimonas denitrificans TaxID=39766 RepID=COAX_SULDN|nr:RecName: Full=Type III pantothenate kinase; AltName: Full=PanK-III; AltName: Full=Pantothenic acid kinase [Sulfurimonas denitrificans DSM 1251]ABB44166.1 pantothenate kinase [Sulfurimonas denitrificans DSM 1251]
MLLCDIGNTTYHFFDENSSYKEDAKLFNPSSIKREVFYICVNSSVKERLSLLDNWIDLSLHVDMSRYYKTMGIDRIMACEAIESGVVVDAGSAITVDIIKNGNFEGGFIYAGVKAMNECYKNISAQLEYSFNFELDLDKMPKNSRDAISYGYLGLLYKEVASYGMKIYLTGGDAGQFSKLFLNSDVDELLLFKGMKNIMKKANLC